MNPGRIVSGGQTGVDRAALDAAIAIGIDYGGWCPKGGRAEDFNEAPGLLARYPGLQETPSSAYDQRTEWNVRDSDGTLILVPGGAAESRGTRLTERIAREMEKPVALLDPAAPAAVRDAAEFIGSLPERCTLNVAGPRESGAPGVYRSACDLMIELLSGRVSRS